MAGEFLTTREVEQLVHLNRVTIYRLIREGQFPAVKVGSQWRFKRSAVEAWLTSHHPTPPSESQEPPRPNEYVAAFHNSEVVRVLQAFSKAMGLSICVIGPGGETILDCMNCHSFCAAMQASQQGRACCQEVRRSFTSSPIENCIAGVSYIKTPVHIADQLIGYIVMGPLVRDAYQMETIRQHLPEAAATLGIAPETLLSELSTIQTLDTGQLEVLRSLLNTVASTTLQITVERQRSDERLKTIARLAAGSQTPHL